MLSIPNYLLQKCIPANDSIVHDPLVKALQYTPKIDIIVGIALVVLAALITKGYFDIPGAYYINVAGAVQLSLGIVLWLAVDCNNEPANFRATWVEGCKGLCTDKPIDPALSHYMMTKGTFGGLIPKDMFQ